MIGKLRNRVNIYGQVQGRGVDGSVSISWALLSSMWAAVKHPSGMEEQETGRTVATRNAVFTMRYLSTVSEDMRITHRGNTYEIEAIRPDAKYVYMDVEARLYQSTPAFSPENDPINTSNVFGQLFTATGTTVTVTENDGQLPSNSDRILVHVNGLQAYEDRDYTVSGSTINFTYTLASDLVSVWWIMD